MKLRALALDYDGTIAVDGTLDPEVEAAIREVRAGGLVVVLVTGRILSDLRERLGNFRRFDAIVAENGAVATFPRSGRSAFLAPRCSRELVDALRERGIDARSGDCIVELDARHAHAVLDIVRERELPLTLHFNRGRLMILPQAVSKATGLREALRTMRLSLHNTIGIGDAENDHALLSACEVGAAVAWGSPGLRAAADVVVEGRDPRDAAAYIRSIASRTRIETIATPRRQLLLGREADGALVTLALKGRNVLIAGDPRSGKSWVAGLLCEHLVLQGYCVCLLDPEGDYAALESLPGVVLLGGDDPPPSMHELARTLRHADVSVVVDLVRLAPEAKRAYVTRALQMLAALRRETGLPHRIVVDEAHHFLHDPAEAHLLDSELAGYTLVTYRVSSLHADVLAATECVIITRATAATEARLLRSVWNGTESEAHWEQTLRELELDEAVLLPGAEESGNRLRRFRIAPRLTRHVRHQHKYRDLPVNASVAFRFVADDGTVGPVVSSMEELVLALARTPIDRLVGHIRRGDLSRWIQDVFGDRALADRIRDLEQRHRDGRLADFNDAAIEAVQARYHESHGPLDE